MKQTIYFISVILLVTTVCTKIERNNPLDANGENWNPPKLTPVNDTTVLQDTVATITVKAVDGNSDGSIVLYYWDIGNNGWDDSTIFNRYTFTRSMGTILNITWGARDNDGVLQTDSFILTFSNL
jgi:hypothetical protein